MTKTQKLDRNRPEAIVIGSRGVNAVGLIRSLGEAGYAVTFASTSDTIESRWTSRYLHLPESEEEQIWSLSSFCDRLSVKPTIFPTDDQTCLMLDRFQGPLGTRAFCPGARGGLSTLNNKYEMAKLASKCGLLLPETEAINLKRQEGCSIPLPVIIKPLSVKDGGKGDIRICRRNEDIEVCFEELRKRGCDKALVQEFLHSEEQEEIGLMGVVSSNGEIIIPATIRKIRSYPIERGSTSYARIQPGMLNSVDEFSLKKFIACTGYSGLFDIEMIVKGGRAYFIEINFRNGQYGYSITCAGFNLPDCYSRLERGVGLRRVSSLREVYYMNEREDRRHVRDGVIKWRKWKCEFRGSAAYGMYCPGDQRPFVRQYVKIPDRVKLRLQRLTSRINGLIYKEEWTLAFRERKGCLLYQEGGKKEPFCILSNSLRYWAADPFIVSEGESDFVFFEMYDRFRGKGVIGCREIERGSVGAMRVVWEERRHLSFPYVFKSGGEWYMMPESSEADDLHLLRAKSFPWTWEPCRVVKTECKVCDSVFIEGDDGVYLLTTPLDCDSLSLMAYRIEEDGFASKQGFSAVDGPSTSRMAGAIFRGPEGLIRPSQDCSRTYGERINFSVIRKLDVSKFEEECIGTASPEELSLSNARESFEGLHTYNCDARYEVIDLKLKKRIQLGNIINLGYRALMRFMP